jgi:hypothetical protein
LSFLAKFIFKTYTIVERIGNHGDGYDNLSRELGEAIQRSFVLITTLLADGPLEIKEHFESNYMELTKTSLANLIALFHDLSWYKNRMIDHFDQGSS